MTRLAEAGYSAVVAFNPLMPPSREPAKHPDDDQQVVDDQQTTPAELLIRTSEKAWLSRLAHSYRERAPVLLIDDAAIGIEPSKQTVLEMGRQANLDRREWVGVVVALGLAGVGAFMVAGAILDPEPTTKLGLLIAGGSICLIGGGFSAIRILTRQRPPTVEIGRGGFAIRWD